ncbi:hypothetical protein BD309DRAFT_991840 [Dichomitus squalens]|nr:hypothetical protein BD309DRAFT_991840 [Dichomitus squalens]
MANNSAVQAISASFFYNCWTDAALALFIYDFILTLDSELMLFWTVGHVSGATILFLLNRYITLASQIIDNNTIPSSVEVDDNAHFPTSVIVYLEEPLTSILTSRFLIDLQKAQRKLAGSSRSVSLGEIAFQPQSSGNTSRFIGSLGAQISFHEVDEGENEAEVAS